MPCKRHPATEPSPYHVDFCHLCAVLPTGPFAHWPAFLLSGRGQVQSSPFPSNCPIIFRGAPAIRARGIDSDNDSVFINEILVGYCEENEIEFTRCRAYHKNDLPSYRTNAAQNRLIDRESDRQK